MEMVATFAVYRDFLALVMGTGSGSRLERDNSRRVERREGESARKGIGNRGWRLRRFGGRREEKKGRKKEQIEESRRSEFGGVV